MPKAASKKLQSARQRRLFAPTLLSLIILSASPLALAANSGGDPLPNANSGGSGVLNEVSYGNAENLTDRIVVIDTSVPGSVFGAYTTDNSKTLSGNSVTVTGTTASPTEIGYDLYGGYVDVRLEEGGDIQSQANSNTVNVSGGVEVGRYVFGGEVYGTSYGKGNVELQANSNIVSFAGSTAGDDLLGGHAAINAGEEEIPTDGAGIAKADSNIVTVTEHSSVRGAVLGGSAGAFGLTGTATANGNTVTVTGGSSVGYDVYGGYSEASADGDGDSTANAYANNNEVVVSEKAVVQGDIYGGYADAYFADINSEQANNNTVIIDGATVGTGSTGSIIAGGAIWVDYGSDPSSDSHNATYNTVSIRGNYSLNDVSFYGGYNIGSEDPLQEDDLFTGNTLNLDARQVGNTVVGYVENFETINIQAGEIANGGIVLDTTGTLLGDGKDNGKGTTVNLLSVETKNLKANDKIILISQAEGKLANDGQEQFVPIGESVALGYDGQTVLDGENVVFNIEGKAINPKTKVLSESRAAEMAFLNAAGDLLLDQDIHSAGKHVFGAIRGISNTYKTGSSVDVDGVGLVTGVANTWKGEGSDLSGAVFVEAGFGDLGTNNNIGGVRQHGKADSYYIGTGFIGKYDLTQGALAGLYAEASARVGVISTDYHNSGLSTVSGKQASYDTDSLYYAAHLKAGYRWNLTDKLDFDVNASYLWSYLESEDVRIVEDKFHFDSIQSHRTRLGAELGYTGDQGYRPYIGAAWEHEFDGEAGGSVEGYRLEEADLGGSSGLVWAGVTFVPPEASALKFDAGITGYFGQRQGISGRISMRYEF